MLEEIMLDKARIAREAADEWASASDNFQAVVADPEAPWVEPGDMAVEWLAGRQEKVMGMTEAELRRAVKQYLNSWVRDELRRRAKAALPEGAAILEATIWPTMLDDLVQAERVARRKAGKKALDPWVAPRGKVTVGGEVVDYTSHEFWTDMYLYALENPEREHESHRNFIRRMGDAGANAKYASEKMPQPRNGIRRAYSLSDAHEDAIVADIDGKFDQRQQTISRPTAGDRRPMGLRDQDWMDRPVTSRFMSPEALEEHRAHARKRFAHEPLHV
jgi:hypothetical protein